MKLNPWTAVSLAAAALTLPAIAADWPQYRGPLHDGSSPESIRTNWTTSPPRVLWRRSIAPGWSSIVVSGGHPNSPWPPLGAITNTWVSPQKADEDPNLVLVADLNVYCYSFPRILAPHTAYSQSIKDEAYFDEHSEAYSQTPADIGAQGGNVGKLDGSAAWKNFKDMRTYRASFLWETDGAFGMW